MGAECTFAWNIFAIRMPGVGLFSAVLCHLTHTAVFGLFSPRTLVETRVWGAGAKCKLPLPARRVSPPQSFCHVYLETRDLAVVTTGIGI